MKKKSINILFLVFLLFSVLRVNGQSFFTTKGTDFWFGFMQNYPDNVTDKMKVFITTDNQAASGTISIPLAGWTQNYTVSPNSTTEIILPTATVMCVESEIIENKGVHVTSDIPVTVYQLNYEQQTADAAIIIPTTSLGTRYRAMCYSADQEFQLSELLIVAAYDNTVLKITPTSLTVGPGGTIGHTANIPFFITLNQGQVYQVQGNSMPPNKDLSGTLIELDTTVTSNCNKFAVFAGNKCAYVPLGIQACDHLCEQMMPIKIWGQKYITIPLKTRATDLFRIIAAENGTMVTWDGSAPIGLNAGDIYDYSSSTATFVESNKPISVAQFSKGSQADGVLDADPFMILLQPLDQSIGKIVFNSFSSTIITAYYLNVVTRTAYTNMLTLDGVAIPPTAFTTVPYNNSYSYARIDLTQGNHSLESDSGYTANVYGYGNYESYGYIAGATFFDPEIGFNVMTPTDTFKYYFFTDTICKGNQLTFSAFSNPLITEHSWSFGDGSSLAHGQTVSHNYNDAGSYYVTYYYEKSTLCGIDSIVLKINIKCCNVSPGIAATSPVCVGNNSTITDTSSFSSTATYLWDFGNGNVISGSGQGPYQVNWSSEGTDTVKVYVSEPNCSVDSAYKKITITPVPTSAFELISPICSTNSTVVTYTGNASPSSTYNWNFDGGNVISGTGQGPSAVIWSTAGTYNITLNVMENGCTSAPNSVPIVVLISPVPSFIAVPQTTFIEDPVVSFFDKSLNTVAWSWNFGEPSTGQNNYSSLQSPTHTYTGKGEYTVWLVTTSADGCIDSTSTNVRIIQEEAFYIPNSFTPDADGLNEVFEPLGPVNFIFTLYIFNRWGQQIFVSEKPNQGWDGKFNGKYVEPLMYIWCLKYHFDDEAENITYGRVTLIR
ncbi:MAG: T9SS type B sorting domain-containing protein [Bacteroidetes bacterium]|nr:T9SS type B sorting domain-containing protein [Bacteroidota bacterium]